MIRQHTAAGAQRIIGLRGQATVRVSNPLRFAVRSRGVEDALEFRTAIDAWYWVVVVMVAVTVIGVAIPAFLTGPPLIKLVVLLAAVVAIGLPLWLARSTVYIVTDELLLVSSGPFSWRVPRDEITHVAPTRTILSSPALSLDRLEVRYGAKVVVV